MPFLALSDLVFHRIGGLNLTVRFKEGELPIIPEGDFESGAEPVEISFHSGSGMTPSGPVRRFIPRSGDVTGRRYTDDQGANRWVELPPYALVDPQNYMLAIVACISQHALTWASTKGPAHREAVHLIESGGAPWLRSVLEYDFGRFQKTGSAVLAGPETLGIPPLASSTLAIGDRRPLPRMVTAQSDIVLSMILRKCLDHLLGRDDSALVQALLSSDAADTHVAYVALRILTEGTVFVLVDKERRDRENNSTDKSLQIQLQASLNSIVHTFSSKRFGLDYATLERDLPLEAAVFYSDLDKDNSDALYPPWKNTTFWLPTLRDVVARPFEAKTVW